MNLHKEENRKRILIYLSLFFMLLSIPLSSYGATQFPDLGKSYAEKEILYLKEAGILSGDANGQFRPLDSVTRAQMAQVLVKAFDLEIPQKAELNFRDVKESDWYFSAVNALVQSGISKGTSEETFSPNASITRQELAVFLVKAMKLEDAAKKIDGKAALADYDEIQDWAKSSVTMAFKIGLIKGTVSADGSTRFNPTQSADRQALARLIYESTVNKKEFLEQAQKLTSTESKPADTVKSGETSGGSTGGGSSSGGSSGGASGGNTGGGSGGGSTDPGYSVLSTSLSQGKLGEVFTLTFGKAFTGYTIDVQYDTDYGTIDYENIDVTGNTAAIHGVFFLKDEIKIVLKDQGKKEVAAYRFVRNADAATPAFVEVK